ncbi:SIR2 family protein [Aminipila sp.]|uniref:SIR2 family protein n=1 Tax=Aminipila sp. TaxID=2060095 RepID=UPI0028A1FFD1|nr:SIR2 family protein [Aminipila sp.]
MDKTVIFLGAGASKADGAPLQRELFKSYFKACEGEKLNENFDIKHSKVKGLLDRYFKNFFDFTDNFDYRNAVFPTFEEALGILDLAIERNEKYRSELGNLYKYRTALIFSMAQAIQYKIEASKNGIQGESHTKLIENLQDELPKGNITFISTNYDIILDNALGSKFDVDYGFYHLDDLDNIKNGVKLLKIHGSLNWKYCPVCKHIEAKIEQKGTLSIVDNPGSVKCDYCSADAQYIIVPPTYYKDMSNVYLANIWNNAEKLLREAEHIVFSGYSLPSADMHIKYLLKRAELNRGRNSKFKATVINYYPNKIVGAIQKEQNRYSRFFKNTSDVNYVQEMSFQDFARNPFQVLE